MYQVNIRDAVVADAPALGRVMVESWLAAHRGLLPAAAWQQRANEWTPEVSALAWLSFLTGQAEGGATNAVLLVAEGEKDHPLALVLGSSADGAASVASAAGADGADGADGAVRGTLAEISDLFVLPEHHGEGMGSSLLRAAASRFAAQGCTALQVCVLTTNRRARGFYEAMGAHEHGRRAVREGELSLPLTVYAWEDLGILVEPA